MRSRILGTGSYLPEAVVTNFDLEQRLDTTDAWIRERTGIERRHIVAPGETTVDMAEHAARAALQAAGRAASEVDLIIVGTCTPDLIFPNAGVMLQARLGNFGSPALGVFYTTGDGVCASDNSFYKKCQAGGSWSSQFNNPQASPNVSA